MSDARSLSSTERRRFDDAVSRHFVVTGQGEEPWGARAYFRWCEAHGEPYVRVRRRRRYATVSCDTITMPWSYPPVALSQMVEYLRKYSVPGAYLFWGVWTESDRVPIEHAETLAVLLYSAATSPVPLSQSRP